MTAATETMSFLQALGVGQPSLETVQWEEKAAMTALHSWSTMTWGQPWP